MHPVSHVHRRTQTATRTRPSDAQSSDGRRAGRALASAPAAALSSDSRRRRWASAGLPGRTYHEGATDEPTAQSELRRYVCVRRTDAAKTHVSILAGQLS